MATAEARFIEKFGEAAAEEMFEDFYAHQSGKAPRRFAISEVQQHDAVNYRFRASAIAPDGEEYLVECEDGNRNGSQILKFEPDGPMEERTPTVYSFKPNRWLPRGLFQVYVAWRKKDWFIEKQRGLNYDRFFAPGSSTMNHYRDWAASRGMEIATEEACDDYVKRGPMTDEDKRFIEMAVSVMSEGSANADA